MYPKLKTRLRWAMMALRGEPVEGETHVISNATLPAPLTLSGEGQRVMVIGNTILRPDDATPGLVVT